MRKVAYVPREVAMPKNLTGQEIIDEQVALKRVKDLRKLHYLMEYFEVDPKLEAKDMSLGMKRKIALVCAFSDDPDIVILDEPSSGLDIDMQAKFIDYILEPQIPREDDFALEPHVQRGRRLLRPHRDHQGRAHRLELR